MRKWEIEGLRATMSQVHDLIHEKKEFQEAYDLCQRVRTTLAEAGVTSSFLCWQLGVACDYLQRPAEALEFVEEAIRMDPLAPPFPQSHEVIVRRIRATLTAKDRAPDDPSTGILYQLLLERGEADIDCHLTMARFHGHAGRPGDAARILEALTVLFPGCREGWEALEACARELGNDTLAAHARAEVVTCEVRTSQIKDAQRAKG